MRESRIIRYCKFRYCERRHWCNCMCVSVFYSTLVNWIYISLSLFLPFCHVFSINNPLFRFVYYLLWNAVFGLHVLSEWQCFPRPATALYVPSSTSIGHRLHKTPEGSNPAQESPLWLLSGLSVINCHCYPLGRLCLCPEIRPCSATRYYIIPLSQASENNCVWILWN